jgi:hypothetical protein
MLQNILKGFMIALVFVGTILSVLNFVPRAEATPPTIYGTTTTITTPDELWYWTVIYGPGGMSLRWLHENLTYCLDVDSNCCIVFGN